MGWREYHEATKHTPEKLRRNARALDWANMPDPFRHYEGAPLVDLACDGSDWLSEALFHAAAVSATKVAPSGMRYALRVNPSSGNLHPTEFHFATRGVDGWRDGLYHYRPSSHMAELRGLGSFFGGAGRVVFVLTTIAWREAWKYGERAYRYCLLDAGHAWMSLVEAFGPCTAAGQFDDDALAREMGLSADEWPLMLVEVGSGSLSGDTKGEWFGGVANRLSEEAVPYPRIERVHEATKVAGAPWIARRDALGLVEWARQRRSALDFRGGVETMSREEWRGLMAVVPRGGLVRLFAYVHRVEGMAPGLYGPDGDAIRLGDQRVVAAGLSLGQDLAGNSCVTFSMVADLDEACRVHGERGYRYAHFEAGGIGQLLYLKAEEMGMRGTGIGAFFDDRVNEYLGVGQVIYHFAVGFAVPDQRLEDRR